ncbi:MAG: DUF3822 family protein [Prolixibacteraceae bacterium]|nr:DUF3822 family protein [Prolixibacteraceae bacterium]
MFATPFIDETFDIHNGQQYTLSIQCALDGFSFSVYDLVVRKFIVFAEYEISASSPFELRNTLETIVHNEPILQQTYKHVKICWLTRETTLVPEVLYKSEEAETLFQLTFEANRANELIANQATKSWIILTAYPRVLKEWFQNKFQGCRLFSPAIPLFHYAAQHHLNAHHLLVYRHSHSMYVLNIKEGQPELLNSFFVKNETDCLYYLLNVRKQLSSDTKQSIVFMGKIGPGSELDQQLKKYFEKVHYAQPGQHYTLSYTFHQEPVYYHLPTLELALCE